MKKVLSVVVDILAWILLIFAFLITIMVFGSEKNNGVPTLLGYMPMSVQSDSMSPTFKKGDLIVVKKVDDLYSLKEDDVITFYTIVDGQKVINTHRIVRISEEDNTKSFITRGDNNPVDDETPVSASDIIGKWTKVKVGHLGKFVDFVTTKTGFFICVLIPIAIFFIFELYKFIAVLIETKQVKITEEDEEEIKRKAVEEYLANKEKAEKKVDESVADKAEDVSEEVADKAEAVIDELKDKAESVEEKVTEAVKDVTKED